MNEVKTVRDFLEENYKNRELLAEIFNKTGASLFVRNKREYNKDLGKKVEIISLEMDQLNYYLEGMFILIQEPYYLIYMKEDNDLNRVLFIWSLLNMSNNTYNSPILGWLRQLKREAKKEGYIFWADTGHRKLIKIFKKLNIPLREEYYQKYHKRPE